MENFIILMAACLCGSCAILSFLYKNQKKAKMIVFSLWCLSTSMLTAAIGLMIRYQILSRFEYQYVYNHTSRNTELIYKISSLWSGQEGSFLLWAFISAIMGLFLIKLKKDKSNNIFGIYSLISFCIIFMCYITKPFAKMPAIPLDGLGLNKMLMDPWMVIHPPLVFISYSSMAILFSFCAALTKNADSDNTVYHIKTWIKISWFFLGAGILSGSIWAYRTLGWGGYWSWDPIENAALVPWLILCSCIHRNEYGKSVCIIPFSVACFGVFLARSGILKDRSAHAYTEGNAIITWITISFIIGAIIYLIISKARHAGIKHLKNSIFKYDKRLIIYSLNSYAALIFIGTVAPVIANIQISAAYFNFISIVFALTYIFLLLMWDYKWLKKWNIPTMMVSTILIIGVILLTDSIKIGWMIILWICMMPFSLWIVCRFKTKQWRYYLSHAGMILLIIGAISSSALCNDNFIKASKNDTKVNITGIEVSISELIENDTLIKSSVKSDAIIKCSDIYPLSQGGFIIPYTTKPLIKLFWIGCFAVVVQPLIIIISNKLFRLFSRFICRDLTVAAKAR